MTTARGVPFRDFHIFVAQGLRIDTCKSTGLSIGIFAYRRLDRPEAEVEAAKYRTAEGLRVSLEEAEVLRILGRPEATSEWTERQGTIDIPLVQYSYSGLMVRISQIDRRVLAIGVERPGAYSACEGDIVVLQALRDAAQRPIPAITRPVALTSCEIGELRRRLINEADARGLYWPSLRLAEEALDELPGPLPRIQLEGLLPTNPRAQLSTQFYRDVRRIEALGYAYAATGDNRFAERAGVYVEAWASTNQPDGNPINETQISRLVLGLSLVSEAIPPSLRTQVERWLNRMASLQIERRPQWEIDRPNNWYSHRLKIVGLIGYALDDSRFIRYAEDGYRAQIAQNLRPDGSSLDLHQRDALHYHVYNLEPRSSSPSPPTSGAPTSTATRPLPGRHSSAALRSSSPTSAGRRPTSSSPERPSPSTASAPQQASPAFPARGTQSGAPGCWRWPGISTRPLPTSPSADRCDARFRRS
ncbi:MAG: alginate lyase family protein [Armatimonadota bacterium]|nr:alginate lyase family protein [Armatimonadota bacterium]